MIDPAVTAGFFAYLATLKNHTMKHFIVIWGASAAVLTALVTSSCDKITVSSNIRRDLTARGEGERSRQDPGGGDGRDSPACEPSLYVTAVDFPDNYNWRRDTAYGNVSGRILLFKDAQIVSATDAGTGTVVSTAPDRHHFAGGHLYTEYCDGQNTVYGCDGKQVFSTVGKEFLKGIIVSGDDLYTLSQNSSGTGFVLRKNWEEQFRGSTGEVHGSLSDPSFGRSGALYLSGETVCFIYSATDGSKTVWKKVSNGHEESLSVTARVQDVYDIREFDGKTCLVVRETGGSFPVLYIGSVRHDLSSSKSITSLSPGTDLRLFKDGDEIRFSGTCYRGGNVYYAFWNQDLLLDFHPGECSIFEGDSYVSRTEG